MILQQQQKDILIKQLRNNKLVIEEIRNSLMAFQKAGEVRKALLDTEFSILSAMHKISWMGEKHEDEQKKEILSYTDKKNLSG